MSTPGPIPGNGLARKIARAALDSEMERTGRSPASVTVVITENTLVITFHGALSEAEKHVAQNSAAVEKLQEYHRQLFASTSGRLREEILRITGVAVREASAEIDTGSGTIVHAFTSGATVQVFLLSSNVLSESWSGSVP